MKYNNTNEQREEADMSTRIRLTVVLIFCLAQIDLAAQWIQTNGPEGGFVPTLASNGSTIYAGVDRVGIYKSSDGGENWKRLNVALPYDHVKALLCTPTAIYAGSTGLFTSYDDGQTWTSATTLSKQSIWALGASGNLVYAGTIGGHVFRSVDGGGTWFDLSLGLPSRPISSIVISGTTVFAGTSKGIFMSNDSGANWQSANVGLLRTNILTLAASGQYVFAGTDGGGVYRSSDNGGSWQGMSDVISDTVSIYSLQLSANKLYAAVSGRGVFQSSDQGLHWTAKNTNDICKYFYCLNVSGTMIYAGTGSSGVCVSSDDGLNWSLKSKGIYGSVLNTLDVLDGDLWTCGSVVAKSSDKGDSWTNFSAAPANVLCASVSSDAIYLGCFDGVFRSTDKGGVWKKIPSIDPSLYIYAFARFGSSLYLGTNTGIILSSVDDGSTWNQVFVEESNSMMSAFARIGDTLFAATKGGGVYRSMDGGKTWMTSLVGLKNRIVNCLATTGSKLFAGSYGNGVYVSEDRGGSWVERNTSMTDANITSLYAAEGLVIAGTSSGLVYVSKDDGRNWQSFSDGLRSGVIISAIKISASNIYLSTSAVGVWKRPLADVVASVEDEHDALAADKTVQFIPSPCDQKLLLALGSVQSEGVSLRIINSMGQTVELPTSSESQAGIQGVEINTTSLANGVYYCILKTESYQLSKPFVVLHR